MSEVVTITDVEDLRLKAQCQLAFLLHSVARTGLNSRRSRSMHENLDRIVDQLLRAGDSSWAAQFADGEWQQIIFAIGLFIEQPLHKRLWRQLTEGKQTSFAPLEQMA